MAAGLTDSPEGDPPHALIRCGEVRTYKEVAQMAESPNAHQSVDNAMKYNPIPLLIPCHRVVPSQGGIGHWGYGAALKRRLLHREGVVL
jgi:methylated-DNA-[protein]-cysteine S-methyltransferase